MLLLVKLTFKSALRLGGQEPFESRAIIHSDTLFSAILNHWAKLYGGESIINLARLLNKESPPFKISSAFPYILSDYYLPTPYGVGDIYREELKDHPFLELYNFLELAKGNEGIIKKRRLRTPIDDLMSHHVTPRVTIDRINAATNIYQTESWLLDKRGGLYFLLYLKDRSIWDKLRTSIKMLGESGLGGDRSIGYGLFDAEFENIEGAEGWSELFEERHAKSASYCTLSLCYPSVNEASNAISYRVLARKGWISSSSSIKQMKRRQCNMFTEGSIFSKYVRGGIVDVTPSEFYSDHNIYRYGLSMLVELTSQGRNEHVSRISKDPS